MLSRVVIDAPALAEFLLGTESGERVADTLAGVGSVHAPHLLVSEVTSVIRRWDSASRIDETRASIAISELSGYPLQLWDVRTLLVRVWAMRRLMTAYDANYAVVAELLNAPLLTTDSRFARTLREHTSVTPIDCS